MPSRKSRIFKVLTVCFFLLFSSLSSLGIEVRDSGGERVFLEKPPLRIISLAPSFTKAIFLLGEGRRLVGVTRYCVEPPEAKKLPKVGSVVEFNLEEVIKLSPDLVLATPLTPPMLLKRLEEIGIKTMVLKTPETFQELCDQFLTLSKILGVYERGEEIVKSAKKRIEEITKSPKKRSPRVFIQVGINPIWTAGEKTLIGEALKLAGGENIFKGRGGPVSEEWVLKENPEVILIMDMGLKGNEMINFWKRFKEMEAVKHNRIHILNSNLYCSPTPLSFVEGVKIMWSLLQKE